jgi:immunity protein, SdpI family
MNTRPLLIVTAVVVAAELVLAGWAWIQLPAGAQLPVHWDINGRANGYADAWFALGLMPVITVVLGPILAVAPRFDPRRENLARSAAAYRWIVGSALVLMGAVQLMIVLAALDYLVDPTRFLGVGIGVLFVVIGNFLGKTRSSWFLGIRTPWTLSSERSWTRTHRLGAYLFMGTGGLSAVASFLFPPAVFFWVLMVGLTGSVIVLFVYSYLVWRDDPEHRTL